MKLNLLLAFAVLLTLAFSCHPKLDPSEKIINNSLIRGPYVIASFVTQDSVNFDSLNNAGAFDFGKVSFNFQSNDSVTIFPYVAKEFFGDSIYRYQLTNKNIHFIKGDVTISLPYIDDSGIFRISVEHKYWKRLDIIPAK